MMQKDHKKIYVDLPVGWKATPDVPTCCPAEAREFEDSKNMCKFVQAMLLYFGDYNDPHGELDHVLSVTAGVLHLGNIEMVGADENVSSADATISDTPATKHAVEWVCRCWQVNEAELRASLTRQTLNGTAAKMGKLSSELRRDALARHVYYHLFMWLVEQCSDKLKNYTGKYATKDKFLGVLDIFGFEFVVDEQLMPKSGVLNSLEQLCINMCNEELQGLFVTVVFEGEKALYAEQFDMSNEAVSQMVSLGDIDNRDTLSILKGTQKPNPMPIPPPEWTKNKRSIKSVANDYLSRDTDSDEKFYTQLGVAQKKSKVMEKRLSFPDYRQSERKRERAIASGKKYPHKDVPYESACGFDAFQNKTGSGGFCVDHYAAKVTYDVDGWHEKNMDKLTVDLYEMLTNSADERYMKPRFEPLLNKAREGTTGKTLFGDFAEKLDELTDTLGATTVSFVRCIKATQPLAPRKFNRGLVLNQLQYTGMLDTLNIRRSGFPDRMTHKAFWEEFHVIAPVKPPWDVPQTDGSMKMEYEPVDMQRRVEAYIPQILESMEAQSVSTKTAREQLARGEHQAIRMGLHERGEVDGNPTLVVPGTVPPSESLVFCRDWLTTGLRELKADVVKGEAVTIQSVYRASHHSKHYRKIVAARDIQSVTRTFPKTFGFQTQRLAAQVFIKEYKHVAPIAAQAAIEDAALLGGSKAEMDHYLTELAEFEQAEQEERQNMQVEDDYCEKLAAAGIESKIQSDYHDHKAAADFAFKKYQDIMEGLQAKLDAPAIKSAGTKDDSPDQQTVKTAGVVRSVPLVRRFRQGGSAKWTPPPRTAYQHFYEFECKRPDQ